MTSAYCGLAVLERNFSEALRRLDVYSGETLPPVGSGGYGAYPKSKIYSEGLIHLWAGDRQRAFECFDSERWHFETQVRDDPKSHTDRFALARVYAMMGWKKAALTEVARGLELERKLPPEQKTTAGLAEIYAWAGEPDLAWHKIEEAPAQPATLYVNDFRLDPRWDPLRKDPRFQHFLATHKP